ncbi:hypothetical protein KDL01_00970 [Actinospica durhamensis]|uniref:Tetratricopeptide repeat protein n=1 Tax=Actinospica durhamensis TaxID=1508375 RepID=A0A941ILK1_9ACTN|nr:hypothetical protein [Actinospica durhamensis]MBR7831809.1 hypothetical protein [Actinospica durhamensis]
MAVAQSEVFELAYRAWDAQDYASASPLLIEAARAAEAGGEGEEAQRLWFDAALAAKFLRDWPRALELGRTAASTAERDAQDPAFWNLGIAATVLHDWDVARDAWLGYGIRLTSTTGEVREDFGMTPIRLDPDGRAEVVWAQRICPTRAIVRSVPMRADRHFGDVILHDGAPNGQRIVGEATYSVFDEIHVWQPSDIPTWTVIVDADEPGAADLVETFEQHELGAEPASSMKPICACCSTGDVEQQHAAAHAAHGQLFYLAAPEATLFSLLHAWKSRDESERAFRDVTLIVDEGEGEDGVGGA